MRITIDTREDSYQDALSVLRRAYGRHRQASKTEQSSTVGEAVGASTGDHMAQGSDSDASGTTRKEAPVRKASAKGTRKSTAKRTSASRADAVKSAASRSRTVSVKEAPSS